MGRRRWNSDGPDSHWAGREYPFSGSIGFHIRRDLPTTAAFPDLAEQREILGNVNLEPLMEGVSKSYAGVGRRPHDRRAIVRAHFMAYLHRITIGTITALHLTLLNNAAFRSACGFNGRFPPSPTLSRVFTQMAQHPDVVEWTMDEIVRDAKRIRPDLGDEFPWMTLPPTLTQTRTATLPLIR
ncbi:MAG: transposase, partial [Dehalococcoidia bacterium]|nr:transposase [Dehalococcoidia bacterium]